MALLPYKNISSDTYFLGFCFLGDWFYLLTKKGREINTVVIGQEEVYVIW